MNQSTVEIRPSLYVGDLDPAVTEIDLFAIFGSVSDSVSSVHLCRDLVSGKSLRYAYVNFRSFSDALRAMHYLNYSYLNGKAIRIMWSQRNPSLRKLGVANLFVKNLDSSIDTYGLYCMFRDFGNVITCKVSEEEDGKSKGFGFVQFDNEGSALYAIKALHGAVVHGKKLYVSKFLRKSLRESEESSKHLYIKNLDHDLTEEMLKDRFSEFGKVSSLVITKDDRGISKGFGFINFNSAEDAKKAMEAMNGAQLGSKKVSVKRAQKKSERQEVLRREREEILRDMSWKLEDSSVFVKNLDVSVDDYKLREHFVSCGRIISTKIMRHESGLSKGFGVVCFATLDEAKKAVATLNGSVLQGRSLYTALAQKEKDQVTASQIRYIQQRIKFPDLFSNLVFPTSALCPCPFSNSFKNNKSSEHAKMKKYTTPTTFVRNADDGQKNTMSGPYGDSECVFRLKKCVDECLDEESFSIESWVSVSTTDSTADENHEH
ncbi:hypothetical protein Scep_024593 [Stephania cephalantha]|uniref:RRM domain-containing protein n=1 Tax=Stephania cephalantha TaxID=152367 RepID=A0AAP0F299_9MAGN